VRGDLAALLAAAGDFPVAGISCLASGTSALSALDGGTAPAGGGFFYLVRAESCSGAGSYDGGAGQARGRDAAIGLAPGACP
jgi:hypothetical protein